MITCSVSLKIFFYVSDFTKGRVLLKAPVSDSSPEENQPKEFIADA